MIDCLCPQWVCCICCCWVDGEIYDFWSVTILPDIDSPAVVNIVRSIKKSQRLPSSIQLRLEYYRGWLSVWDGGLTACSILEHMELGLWMCGPIRWWPQTMMATTIMATNRDGHEVYHGHSNENVKNQRRIFKKLPNSRRIRSDTVFRKQVCGRYGLWPSMSNPDWADCVSACCLCASIQVWLMDIVRPSPICWIRCLHRPRTAAELYTLSRYVTVTTAAATLTVTRPMTTVYFSDPWATILLTTRLLMLRDPHLLSP